LLLAIPRPVNDQQRDLPPQKKLTGKLIFMEKVPPFQAALTFSTKQ